MVSRTRKKIRRMGPTFPSMSRQGTVDPELLLHQLGQGRSITATFGLEDPDLDLLLLAFQMPPAKRGKGTLEQLERQGLVLLHQESREPLPVKVRKRQ